MANSMQREPRELVSLGEAMDRLFDQALTRPVWGNGHFGALTAPAVDVCETDAEVIVTAAVPGMKPEDLKVSVTGDTLEIKGETQANTERKDATYHVRERRYGRFQRVLPLPASVRADRAKAEFENGVLTLTLPKSDTARRKTITIKPKR